MLFTIADPVDLGSCHGTSQTASVIIDTTLTGGRRTASSADATLIGGRLTAPAVISTTLLGSLLHGMDLLLGVRGPWLQD